MGLEQALTYGLLGMVGGGAKVIQEQEKADRENAAKRADEDARTERELAIEERKLRLAGQIRHEQLPDRLAEIKAESDARRDPTESALHAEQLKQLRDSNKLPPAVKANYDTLSEQNKLIASSIYKAQAEGTYTPETAAKAEAQMTENNRRMGELLKPYLGESAPKEGGGIDLSSFDRGRKPAELAQPSQPQPQPQQQGQAERKFYTPEQQRAEARRLIDDLDRRDSMSIARTRAALNALDQEQIGAIRKQAGI